MNKKMVFNMLGRIVMAEAGLLVLPTVCAAIYKESCIFSFLITIAIALVVGTLLLTLTRTKDKVIFAKEGFVIVALSWIVLSAIGALPFFISREIPSYVDAFFETVSGFTTTGSSIVPDVEAMSHGILFWRGFTNWVGGMGILVLVMAILPTDSGRSMHIIRAEMPGPIVGKLVPKIKSTAKILYFIYIGITSVLVVLLVLGGMSLFNSLCYAFGIAGTGGFGVDADGFAGYSPYIQWVATIFMAIYGINFNLYFLLLTKKFVQVLKSEELRVYLLIILISTGIITYNIYPMYSGFSEAVRTAAFQVSSIMTTTGYSSVDFNLWPSLSKGILLILMFFGACAGSTAGGIKISRVILLFKTIKANLRHMLHPRSVESIKFEGKTVEQSTVNSVTNYLAVYCLCVIVIFLIICIDPFDIETHVSATAACFNNIGPGFSSVGPLSNYSGYSAISKITLSAAMLLGRLEIFPMLLLFSPTAWAKKRVR